MDIDGGALDGTVIGANSAAAGTFSGITGPIGASSASTGAFTTLSASSAGDLNSTVNISGTVSLDGSANELRFYEGSNYVGFEAPSLSADKIWVLPDSDGSSNQVLQTDGSGTLSWTTITATSVGTLSGGTPLVFEGATADAYETSFAITDPSSSDKTITFPDATGTVITTGNSGSLTSAANLATVGSVTSGTWRATAIANDKVDDDLTISGGSVDGSPIGSSSPSSGAFTTVTASTSLDVTGSNGIIFENDETITNSNDGTLLITANTTKVSGDLTVTGNDIVFDNNESISNQTDGTILVNGILKAGTGSAAGEFVSNGNQDVVLKTGNGTTGSITIVDGANGDISVTPDGSGSVVVSKADINSGAIDGTAIGGSSASTGAFTTLAASGAGDLNNTVNISGTVSLDGSANELRFYEGANYVGFEAPSLSADKIWVLPDSDGSSNQVLKTDGSGNLSWTAVSATQTTVTDNESTSENNLITFVADAGSSTGAHALEMDGDFYYTPSTGALTATGGAFATVTASTSLDVTGSAGVILENDETITNSSNGTVVIDGILKAGTGSAAGVFASNGDNDVTLKTGNTTSGEITITDGSNGNIAITPDGTGEVDISKVDINSGAIDGTAIGAGTPSTGAFTTLSASGNVDLNAGAIDGVVIGASSSAAGTFTTINGTVITASTSLDLGDNDNLILGDNDDVTISYDETTNDAMEIKAAVDGTALKMILKTDRGDDAGDEWKLNIAPSNGVLTLGNDINSAGTYVTHLTVTPNSTASNSTVATAGNITVGNDLTITGNDITFGNDETISNASDGTVAITATTTSVSGDLTVTGNDITFGNSETISNQTNGEVVVNGILKAGTGSAAGVFASNGDNDVTLKTGNTTSGEITITDGSNGNIAITPDGTGEVDISKVDIAGGEIDAVTLGTNSAVTQAIVDNILIDGNVIGRNDVDQDLITLTNGVVTVAGRVAATTLTGDGSGLTAVPAASISTLAGQDPIVFEGATDNTEETTLRIADPSADRTVTIPDATGTIITTGNLSSITTTGTITSGVWSGTALVDAKVDNDLTISGGTVDNSVIGGSTAAAGTFTTLTGATVNIGNANIAEAELEMIDGITAGTAAASKALVVSSNKDIGTIRNLTIDGTLSDGNYTFDTNGNVSGLGSVSSGAITTSGKVRLNSSEDLANSGAADLTKVASYFTTGSSETGTLAAGAAGQIKTFMMVGDGGDMVITVTNPGWSSSSTSTITFNDIGDAVILQYISSKWFAVGSNGVAFGG